MAADADDVERIQERLETAVNELVQRFGAHNSDQPFSFQGSCSMAVRELLMALEALLGHGLDSSAVEVEAGSTDTPPEPLWAVLKQLRSQESWGGDGGLEAAVAEAVSAVLPAFWVEHGWGRARLLLIEVLNRQCLATLVYSLVLDAGLRERAYPSNQAPMRRPETCAWLQAQAGALQGVPFALRHRLLSATAAGTSEPYSSPDRRPSSMSFPFSVFSPSLDRRSGIRRRRSGSLGLGVCEQDEEHAEERRWIKEAERRLHEGLRLHYGVESAIGFLLQSYPWERVTVLPRKQHRRVMVAKTRHGSRSPSPIPTSMATGGRQEEKGKASGKGAESAGDASGRLHVAVWQWEVAYHDIGFHAALQLKGKGRGGDEKVTAVAVDAEPWARHPASAGLVEGSADLPPSLSLLLRWDNSYSLRRAKDLSLRVAVVPLEAYNAARMTAREAMEAALWRRLASDEPADGENGFRTPCSSPHKPTAAAMAFSSPCSFDAGGQVSQEAFPLSPSRSPFAPSRTRPRSSSTTSVDSAVSLRERDGGFWSYLQSMIKGADGGVFSLAWQESGNTKGGEAGAAAPPPLLTQLQRSSSSSSSSSSSLSLSNSATQTATHCQMCEEGFGFLRRPHRCRRCQGAFCLSCSRHYVILPGAAEVLGRPQRVCDRCYVQSKDKASLKRQSSADINRSGSWASTTLSLSSAASSRASSLFSGGPEPAAAPIAPVVAEAESKSGDPGTTTKDGPVNNEYEALKLKPEMGRYFKMLDVGVPAIAVTHKMAADGIDEAWICAFVAGSTNSGSSTANKSGAPDASPGGGSNKSGKPPLPLLRRASSISSSSPSPNNGGGASPSLLRLRSVHFEQLAPGRAERSVFLRRRSSAAQSMLPLPPTASDAASGMAGPPAAPLVAVVGRGGVQGQTVKELAELFSVTPRPRLATAGGVGGVSGRRCPVFGAALDSRRLQNVGIVYTYFKKSFTSTDELLHTILALDRRQRIPTERFPGLLDILPSSEETGKLLTAAGFAPGQPLHQDPFPTPSKPPAVPLHEAETFMLHTLRVPRLPAKVRALHFMLGWQEMACSLVSRMETLQRAFTDILKSERLVRVLEHVLLLGNTLNAYSGSGAACVVETFTLDSLMRVALTKSTAQGSDATLLEYLVRLAAEQGEGAVLDVGHDMPTLRLAAALPDSSAVLREARLWVRDFQHLREEAKREAAELDGYEEARVKEIESKRQAAEERLRAARAAQEAAREKAEEEKRQAAAHDETLRAMRERLSMEQEDGLAQGEHFLRFLDEAESEYATSAPVLWGRLLGIMLDTGPPIPQALQEEDGDEGVRRLHHELGGKRGDCPEQQRLLMATSRYLGGQIRLARAVEAQKKQQQPGRQATAGGESAATTTEAAPARRPPPPFIGGGAAGGGRGALLAALRGRGGRFGGRGVGRGGGARPAASPSSIEEEEEQEQQQQRQEGPLKVQYEAERTAFAAGLAGFASGIEARVEAVAAQARALEGASMELFEYWGEDATTASSSRLLQTLGRFLSSLDAAKQRYERRHGPIITPDALLEEAAAAPEEDQDVESSHPHQQQRQRRRRRRSSLPPLAVGQRVVTVFGPGVVEAVRVRDRTHVVRFFFGSGLGVGYLKGSALVGPGARVVTPFGKGLVEEVERGSGVHRVRLDWGARASLQLTAVRAVALGEEEKEQERPPKPQPQPSLPPRQEQALPLHQYQGRRGRGSRSGGRRRSGNR